MQYGTLQCIVPHYITKGSMRLQELQSIYSLLVAAGVVVAVVGTAEVATVCILGHEIHAASLLAELIAK